MDILRTPDNRFENLSDYPFAPHYLEVPAAESKSLRIHYVDEGPKKANPVLLMHGEPSWSYLYRRMIPLIVGAGAPGRCPGSCGIRALRQTGSQK